MMNLTREKNIKNKPLIISDGCCIQYGDSSALDDVTFSISEGKKVAVVGPNGGGKSTLFNAIAGLLPLAHGSLKIKGMDPHEAKGLVSYVAQKDLINWNFSLAVKDVVEMGLTNKNSFNLFSRKKINEKIKDSLNNVGLLHKINENINNLSGGQLQRVLIARALAQNADILLLDEAFSAVDVGAQEDIMQLINSINLDGKTVLIATHDINNLEEKFDEVLCLNRHCCAFGDPSEVLTEEVIQEMYGSHNAMFKNHFKIITELLMIIEYILEPFKYDFMIRSIITAASSGIMLSALGPFTINRNMGFMADAMAHATLPIIAVGVFLGFSISELGVPASIIIAFFLGYIVKNINIGEDTAIGIIFSQILAVSTFDTYIVGSLLFIVLSVLIIFFKQLLFFSFDPIGAEVNGLNTTFLNYLFLIVLSFHFLEPFF